MKSKHRYWLVLWFVNTSALSLSPVGLKEGINMLDINKDGVKDYVIVAQFDNNTSHPNLGITFFIHKPDDTYSIMPVANSNTFTWFDYRLSATEDFLIMDNQLFNVGKDYYLITASKKGHNLFDPSLVDLTIYRFKESQDDPGVPLYEWSAHKSLVTKSTYQSATQAYQELDEAALSK